MHRLIVELDPEMRLAAVSTICDCEACLDIAEQIIEALELNCTRPLEEEIRAS